MKGKNHKSTSDNTRWLRYLRRELSEDENYELENTLKKSPDAKSMLQSMAQNDLSSDEVEEDLLDVRNRWKNSKETKIRSLNPWLRRIAAAVFVVFSIWAASQYYIDQKGNNLYANYFESNSYLAVRGEQNDEPELVEAFELYEQQDYERSFAQFQYLSEKMPDNSQPYLYAALSAMQLGRNFEAKALLNKMKSLAITDSEKSAAYWYSSLIYLQENNKKSCQQELQWLLNQSPNGQWSTKAGQLMEKL